MRWCRHRCGGDDGFGERRGRRLAVAMLGAARQRQRRCSGHSGGPYVLLVIDLSFSIARASLSSTLFLKFLLKFERAMCFHLFLYLNFKPDFKTRLNKRRELPCAKVRIFIRRTHRRAAHGHRNSSPMSTDASVTAFDIKRGSSQVQLWTAA